MNVKINDKLISCADGVTVYDAAKEAELISRELKAE